jgi:hypothetical protein
MGHFRTIVRAGEMDFTDIYYFQRVTPGMPDSQLILRAGLGKGLPFKPVRGSLLTG